MQWGKQQRGLTLISMIVILAIIAILVMAGLRLVPVYIQDMTVGSILDSVAEDDANYGPQEIRSTVTKRLDINNVDQVDAKALKINRQGAGYQVLLDYEVRTPFVYNIDFVLTFHHEVQVKGS